MNKDVPVLNYLVIKRLRMNNQTIHNTKIKYAKSSLKFFKKKLFTLPQMKAKKGRLLEEKYTDIERSNKILFERIAAIKGKSNKNLNQNKFKNEKNRNYHYMDFLNRKRHYSSDFLKKKNSMNVITKNSDDLNADFYHTQYKDKTNQTMVHQNYSSVHPSDKMNKTFYFSDSSNTKIIFRKRQCASPLTG